MIFNNDRVRNCTEEECQILYDTMRANADSQKLPKVGMFWYNPERGRLVGVYGTFARDLSFNAKGRKTVRELHHTTWSDVREDALANGSPDKIWTQEDYTQVPRGRVFQIQVPDSDAEYFEILVGKWIYEYPEAKSAILKSFNLENAEFEFVFESPL